MTNYKILLIALLALLGLACGESTNLHSHEIEEPTETDLNAATARLSERGLLSLRVEGHTSTMTMLQDLGGPRIDIGDDSIVNVVAEIGDATSVTVNGLVLRSGASTPVFIGANIDALSISVRERGLRPVSYRLPLLRNGAKLSAGATM